MEIPSNFSAEELEALQKQIAAEVHSHEENTVETGFLTDFTGTIVDAYFTKDENYNKGNSLVLKVIIRNDEDEKDHSFFWSIGNDWEAYENGAYVKSTKPTLKGFLAATTLGTLITMLTTGRFGLQAAKDLLPQNLKTAAPWIGTRWHIKPAVFPIRQSDGTTKDVTKPFPAIYLGKAAIPGQNTGQANQQNPPQAQGMPFPGQSTPTPQANPQGGLPQGLPQGIQGLPQGMPQSTPAPAPTLQSTPQFQTAPQVHPLLQRIPQDALPNLQTLARNSGTKEELISGIVQFLPNAWNLGQDFSNAIIDGTIYALLRA